MQSHRPRKNRPQADIVQKCQSWNLMPRLTWQHERPVVLAALARRGEQTWSRSAAWKSAQVRDRRSANKPHGNVTHHSQPHRVGADGGSDVKRVPEHRARHGGGRHPADQPRHRAVGHGRGAQGCQVDAAALLDAQLRHGQQALVERAGGVGVQHDRAVHPGLGLGRRRRRRRRRRRGCDHRR